MKPITPHLIAAGAVITCATASFAHVVLENKVATAGSTYKAVFQVGYGCGSLPTTSTAVQISRGFQAACQSWLVNFSGRQQKQLKLG